MLIMIIVMKCFIDDHRSYLMMSQPLHSLQDEDSKQHGFDPVGRHYEREAKEFSYNSHSKLN